jgi:hypothetical protein
MDGTKTDEVTGTLRKVRNEESRYFILCTVLLKVKGKGKAIPLQA